MPVEELTQPESMERGFKQSSPEADPLPAPEVEQNPEAESETEPQVPSGEKLKLYEQEVLHAPLSPEVTAQINELRETKNKESVQQQVRISSVVEELDRGVLSRWVEHGMLTPPSMIETRKVELEQTLAQAVEEYKKTEAGQKDLLIADLRESLTNGIQSDEQLLKVASEVGLSFNKMKAKLMPGYKRKFSVEVQDASIKKLEELAPAHPLDDEDQPTWRDAITAEVRQAQTQIDVAHTEGTAKFETVWTKFKDVYEISSEKSGIDTLEAEVTAVEEAQKEGSVELPRYLAKPEILSAITRGSMSLEAVTEELKKHEEKYADGMSLKSVFEGVIKKEEDECLARLPEPSLVGLSLTEKEIKGVTDCLESLQKLAEACGVEMPKTTEEAKHEVLQRIEEAQKLFFERADSANDLYWHFSSRGLKIIGSKQLQPGSASGESNTGAWSEGVHFVKPGLGISTKFRYAGYAGQSMSNNGGEVSGAFGVAIIYELGDILETTPYRDEPITGEYKGNANVSEDVTFRPESQDGEYAYSLDKGYILPMASWEQLVKLQSEGYFQDILEPQEFKSALQKEYEIAQRGLVETGYTQEWIDRHLIDPSRVMDNELLDKFRHTETLAAAEKELFSRVSALIHREQAPESKVVVALSAERGNFESHDAATGARTQFWKERLVELPIGQ